jgi:hydrogenase 3 maturation protease
LAKEDLDVEKQLREWLRDARRVVIVGIGNPIRMDDFVGVKIVGDLRGKVDSERVMLIEAETIPEDHMQEIVDFKPTHILLIDAAKLGLKAGEARLVKPEKLTAIPAYSTHMLPLRIFCEYLDKTAKTEIALLLIEPKKTDFGEKITKNAQVVSTKMAAILIEILS